MRIVPDERKKQLRQKLSEPNKENPNMLESLSNDNIERIENLENEVENLKNWINIHSKTIQTSTIVINNTAQWMDKQKRYNRLLLKFVSIGFVLVFLQLFFILYRWL